MARALSKDEVKALKETAVNVTRKSPLEEKDRLTVLLKIYHEQLGENPTSLDSMFSGMLKKKVEAYTRRITVNKEEMELPLAWMENEEVGHIVIENRTGLALTRNPTEKERKTLEQAFLRVKYKGDKHGWLVAPFGGVFLAIPEDAKKLVIQATNSVPVKATIFMVVR